MSSSSASDAPSSPLSSLPSSRSSSPLSERLSSPTPPPSDDALLRARRNYPSPPASQQTSTSGSPAPDAMDSSASTSKDGQPPAKRRRISAKERTTEHLDLHASTPDGELDDDQKEQLERVMHVLHKQQKIVVIAGAGISVSAGIPDFRSSEGLFRSLREEYNLKGSGKNLFDASVYRDDNSTSSFHDMISSMSKMTKDAKPTAFHHMLATIAQEDRLLRLYSQNVDGIDTAMEPLRTRTPLAKEDGKWPRTVQLHGGLEKMVCSKCRELSPLDPTLFDGPIAPSCPRCEEVDDIRTNHEGKRSHGIGRLRPRMVLYNEHNPDDEAIGTVTKEDLRKRPDAVIVVGTTLKVPGVRRIVREMCATVRDRRGGVTIWINNDPPPVSKDLEDCWDIVVKGTSDQVAKHAAMRQWNEPVLPQDYAELSDESARKATQNALHVRLPSSSPPHAVWEHLPSERHINNSFKPPSPTETPPRKLMERGPPDWSPMGTPRLSIIPSIEDESFTTDDAITVSHCDTIPVAMGLLTPSKSQRNSPVQTFQPVSINEMLKNPIQSKPAGAKAKGEKKTVLTKTKRSNIKIVKPPLSQVKQTKAKAKSKAGAKLQQTPATKSLTNAFKSSKSASMAARSAKSDPHSPIHSPSKLRQVANVSSPSSPMEALSPQDSRNNTSPATSLESSHSCENAIASGKTINIETVVH